MDRKYNIRLDLQFRCNNSVMKFRQSDNKTSDFFMRITSDGDLFNIDNSIVILAVIKPDQSVQSQFLEIREGKVYADLNPNMKDQVGIYKAQALLVYEDERVSTDVIEYEVLEDNILNQLQANVSTTEEFAMLQQMLSRLSTIEQQETQRELNESDRIQAEEDRVAAEKERVKAEDIRNHEEADRSKYEATRQSNENKRIDRENIRISAENKRIYDENIRVDNEASRIAAETERVNNYNFMTDDEERRRTEANSQAAAERLRVEAETERVNEEARRRTVEKSRVAAEQTREQNEKTRALQENDRVTAEQTRAQEHSTKIQSIDTTLKGLETTKTNLVKTVDDKVAEVNTKIQEINKESTDMQNTVNAKIQEVDAAEQQRATDHQAREQFLNSFEGQLAQIENKNIEQDTRLKDIENKNKVQDIYIGGLFNENKDGRLSVEGEGNNLKLEGSKAGLVEIDKVVGNTLVNIGYEKISVKASQNSNSGLWTVYFGMSDSVSWSNIWMKPNTTYTLVIENKPETMNKVYLWGKSVSTTKKVTTITTLDSPIPQFVHFYCTDSVENPTYTVDDFEKVNFMLFEGELSEEQIPNDHIEGIKSSFEENLVTQEMINEGLESEENLGKYKVHVKVRGKNLFDTRIVNSFKVSADKYYYNSGYTFGELMPNLIHGKTYKLSFSQNLTGTQTGLIGLAVVNPFKDLTTSTFIYDESYKDLLIYVYGGNMNGTLSNFMLEEGTVATVATYYEDYFERTANVYLKSPLLEVDEIVMKDGELCHYHRYEEKVLNGSDDEGWVRGKIMETYTGYYITPNVIRDCMVISDKVAQKTYSYYVASLDAEYIATGDSRIVITSTASDLETFKQSIKTNPIKVVYELAEPWYEPIQVDKLLLECANDSTIHIDTVVPVEIKASYTGNVVSMGTIKAATETTECNNLDINDLIIPYCLDLDAQVSEINVVLDTVMPKTENINIKMRGILGGIDMTYQVLKREIMRGIMTYEDCMDKINIFKLDNKLTEVQAEELTELAEIYLK